MIAFLPAESNQARRLLLVTLHDQHINRPRYDPLTQNPLLHVCFYTVAPLRNPIRNRNLVFCLPSSGGGAFVGVSEARTTVLRPPAVDMTSMRCQSCCQDLRFFYVSALPQLKMITIFTLSLVAFSTEYLPAEPDTLFLFELGRFDLFSYH